MMAAASLTRRCVLNLPQSLGHRISSKLFHPRIASRTVASSTSINDGNQQSDGRSIIFATIALAATAAAASGRDHSTALMESPQDDEPTTILNWSGTHSVQLKPGTYHEPESVSELVSLVADAYRNGTHIRPVGSALSPNGLAFDPRGMVCLSNLDKIIEVNKEDMTVTVQAGARVSQVIEALRPYGLTLPNLASIAEQQIGGFVSVGAHGTGASIPPCDDFVTALTIVTPSDLGVVKMTEKTHGNLFRLARLGLGGLGILSEVTLKVVPAHRLVEQTIVLTRDEAKKKLSTLLKRHKHIRYMWIPYEDAVVVVTNDDENDLPLLGAGTEVKDGKGGKKKIVTDADIESKYSRSEQLEPLHKLLHSLLRNRADISIDDDTINGMGFGDLRDLILASGNMLDPDHIKRCNKAEREFWAKAQGLRVLPSDQLLQFDCGGQQWVYEVCFPVGTYGLPNSHSTDFMHELLQQIESSGIPAPSPIEQRWTSASTSPLSPASVGVHGIETYDTKNALFSWVGIIMYLPSEDNDPTGYRREFITKAFNEQYCKIVRKVGQKYGLLCHWAKLEIDDSDDEGIAASVRARLGSKVVNDYNAARDLYDPKRLLSCDKIDKVFGKGGAVKDSIS
jgi:L-galactono-1,4-lactone dehydrogenase